MRALFTAVKFAALALALGCQVASAAWYTARGSAPIIDGNVAQARRDAIDDALRNAALQAGADISIEQVLENGTLLNERMQVKARTPIRSMRVVEEQESGKAVTVLVKALIDDSAAKSDCYAGNLKKTVLPFLFRYEDPDASLTAAGMDDFDNYLSSLIYSGIAQSPALTILPTDRTRLLISRSASGPDYNLQRTLDSISRRTQAQFIIVGSINSLAKSEVGENALTKMIYNPTRTIRFNVKVFDVYSGEQILSKDYSGDAEWTLDSPFIIRSDRFATSDYGQRVQQLAKYAISDIVSTLRCQMPYARVVQVSDDAIRINLGSNDNVKPGMRFNLLHRSDYRDRHNMTYYQHSGTGSTYKVVDVSPNASTLVPVNANSQLLNVMLDDLVILKP